MTIELAKNICINHLDYIKNNNPKNEIGYSVEDIGLAIDTLAESIKPINRLCYYILTIYNLWRRGIIEEYPIDKNDYQDCINICLCNL